ncbi:hypothetical protein OIK40_13425 [Erythrobacter sp. sf7]|uniref:Uncharacterized protein n=1 Tax=Erythrobacter fulvus TaxID=2987523 RepID=A0ABT5JSA4_9SPHN|nr:hypothetical protein [Erythrobacter fulvus]MDC8755645.1 hypothetical protein [Erythrobacter fulvus]
MAIKTGEMPEEWLQATKLRHPIYVALHKQWHKHPQAYTINDANLILGATMRGRRPAWRVVGITQCALAAFRARDYSIQAKSDWPMARAHLDAQVETARLALRAEKPLTAEQLAKLQWDRDMTVICLRKENKDPFRRDIIIPFGRRDWKMFASKQGVRVGRKEQDFLRKLDERCAKGTLAPGRDDAIC